MDKKKKRMVIGGIVGLFLIIFVVRIVGSTGKDQSVIQQTDIPVFAETVSKLDITSSITISGEVQAEKKAIITPKTPGRVESISVKVGDRVKKGQVLFSLDKSELIGAMNQTATSSYQTAKEQYDTAVQNLKRYQELYKIGATSKVEVERKEIELTNAKAAFESASKVLSDMDVKTPIDGFVTSLNVSIGDMTGAASAATVVDLDRVYIDGSVSEKVINQIKNGQEVMVNISSASNMNIKGKIEGLSPAADSTGKYALRIYMDNADHIIKPGMFAKVTLDTSTKKDVLVVPTEAVIFRNGQNVAYVLKDNKAIEREVTTGLDNGKQVEIISGVAEGEILVIKGMNFVKDGTEVKVVELDGMAPNATQDSNQEGTQSGGGAKQ